MDAKAWWAQLLHRILVQHSQAQKRRTRGAVLCHPVNRALGAQTPFRWSGYLLPARLVGNPQARPPGLPGVPTYRPRPQPEPPSGATCVGSCCCAVGTSARRCVVLHRLADVCFTSTRQCIQPRTANCACTERRAKVFDIYIHNSAAAGACGFVGKQVFDICIHNITSGRLWHPSMRVCW